MLNIRKTITAEEQKNMLKNVAAYNITRKLIQLMAYGVIEKYTYNISCCMKDMNLLQIKKKCPNPHKWYMSKLRTLNSQEKRSTYTIAETLFENVIVDVFPFYGEDYIKEYDIAGALQAHFESIHQERLHELFDAAKEMFATIENNDIPKLMAYACVMQALGNGMNYLIIDFMDSIQRMSNNYGIKIQNNDSSYYKNIAHVSLKYLSALTKGKMMDKKKVDAAINTSERFQNMIACKDLTKGLNSSLDAILKDYLDYCIARLTLEYKDRNVPDTIWKFCEKEFQGERSIKILKREMTMLNKKEAKSIEQMMDIIECQKTPVIDLLKNKIMNNNK